MDDRYEKICFWMSMLQIQIKRNYRLHVSLTNINHHLWSMRAQLKGGSSQ